MPPWRAKPCIASRSPGWTWLRAVDNHPTRALVDRHIAGLSDVTLISGGNDETDGNVQLVRRRDGLSVDGHLVEIHPEIGEAATSEVTPGTGCAVLAAERPQLVVAGAPRAGQSNTRWPVSAALRTARATCTARSPSRPVTTGCAAAPRIAAANPPTPIS